MLIYLGADHRGFNLKEYLKGEIKNQGYELVDLGNSRYDENDDYPDSAEAVARKVSAEYDNARGILICGSGVGVDIVANKFKNVRSVLALSSDQVYNARHDDNVNVLSIASDFTSQGDALKIMKVFLATPFGGDPKYRRRLDKIAKIENAS